MSDPKLQKQFKDDPIKVLEKVLNVDLPNDLLEPIVDGVKAKITVDKLGDTANLVKGLFKK